MQTNTARPVVQGDYLFPTDEGWIETYTGKKFHFLKPTNEEIDIQDIAHALGNTCRFTGHCSEFYSVAEHSVYVSKMVPSKYALAGLLHDASEAYITDISSPVKPFLTNYKYIEGVVQSAILKRYGLDIVLPKEVKEADGNQLLTEAKYLIFSKGKDWISSDKNHDLGMVPVCLPPTLAKKVFLNRFMELYNERHT